MINSFIHNFVRTMRKANFNPLTQEQIKFAANPEQVHTTHARYTRHAALDTLTTASEC